MLGLTLLHKGSPSYLPTADQGPFLAELRSTKSTMIESSSSDWVKINQAAHCMRSGLLTITAKGSIGSKFALKMPQQYLFKSWSSEMLCPEAMARCWASWGAESCCRLNKPTGKQWVARDGSVHSRCGVPFFGPPNIGKAQADEPFALQKVLNACGHGGSPKSEGIGFLSITSATMVISNT